MKLTNSTAWPDYMLRRMTAWCSKQLGLPVRRVRHAQFRNRHRDSWTSGHAWTWEGRFCVSVPPGDVYLNDLVHVTAHELRHLLAEHTKERTRGNRDKYRRWGVYGSSEKATEHDAQAVVKAFIANRDALMEEWMRPPAKQTNPKTTRQEKNDARARRLLEQWERKLKLAKTKVSNYRRKVRYYDRVAAKRGKP